MKTIPLHHPPIKLNIVLENMPYPVTRLLLVPENINMMQLHYIIQLAMGWQMSHLFQFSDKKYRGKIMVGLPMEELGWDDYEGYEADEIILKETFMEDLEGKPFWYWYDFGDDWFHKISFRKPTKADLSVYKGVPVCLKAEGACPPEDIGGPWGYADFCEAINDKKHPEYEDLREWMGMNNKQKYSFESEAIEVINGELEGYALSKHWHVKASGDAD